MPATIYKVLSRAALDEAKTKGRFEGTGDDARDGFIHLSCAGQLASTLAKHFAGRKDLVLLAVDTASLGGRLVWEPSRGGALFPHLYGALDLKAFVWDEPLELQSDGRHRLPARVLP
jgi:uncharacterized protein (DUF952 family)